MNAKTILMIIEIVKLLKAIEENKRIPSKDRVAAIGEVVEGTNTEIIAVSEAVKNNPNLVPDILGLAGILLKPLCAHWGR